MAYVPSAPAHHYRVRFADGCADLTIFKHERDDAMPGKYAGLQDCLRVVKPGGFYVIDDMLPQPNWPEGHAEKVPVLLQALSNDPNFSIVLINWATRIVIAVRRAR